MTLPAMFAADALAMIADWPVSISIGISVVTGMMAEKTETNTIEEGGYQEDDSQTCLIRTADYSTPVTIGQRIAIDGVPMRITSYQIDLDKVMLQIRAKQVN